MLESSNVDLLSHCTYIVILKKLCCTFIILCTLHFTALATGQIFEAGQWVDIKCSLRELFLGGTSKDVKTNGKLNLPVISLWQPLQGRAEIIWIIKAHTSDIYILTLNIKIVSQDNEELPFSLWLWGEKSHTKKVKCVWKLKAKSKKRLHHLKRKWKVPFCD